MDRCKCIIVLMFVAAFLICLICAGACAAAQSWTVESQYDQTITFTFDNNHLYLNQKSISQSGPDWSVFWGLNIVSAKCGSRQQNNSVVPDPYASYVSLGDVGDCGYITWAANTPAGYTTSLCMEVLVMSGGFSGGHSSGPVYSTYYNDFIAVVPEPSSILTLLCGMGGVAGAVLRRRR